MGRGLTHVGERGEGLVLVEEGEHLRPAHGLRFFRDGGLPRRRAKGMERRAWASLEVAPRELGKTQRPEV